MSLNKFTDSKIGQDLKLSIGADSIVSNSIVSNSVVASNITADDIEIKTITVDDLELKKISVESGTAANPSLRFKPEIGENTGIYLAGENKLGVTAGGVERLSISDTSVDSSVSFNAPTVNTDIVTVDIVNEKTLNSGVAVEENLNKDGALFLGPNSSYSAGNLGLGRLYLSKGATGKRPLIFIQDLDATTTVNQRTYTISESTDGKNLNLQARLDNGDLVRNIATLKHSGEISLNDGTTGAPSLQFSKTDAGISFLGVSNQINFSTSGVQRMAINDSANVFNNPLSVVKMMNPATPGHTFFLDPDTGMYSNAGDQVGFSTGGVSRISITNTNIQATQPIQFPSYTVIGVPSAATAGRLIYVSNESGGAVMAFSDGTNWRRVTDRAIIT